MRGETRLRVMALLILVLGAMAYPGGALANSAPARSLPGTGGLVVPTTTADVRIDRELLEFDFTRDREAAAVTATYRLANVSTRDASLDLLFIAPRGRDPSARIAGRDLAIERVEAVGLPEEWLAPRLVLDPRSGEEYDLGEHAWDSADNRTWALPLALPAGESAALVVQYRSVLGYDRERADYVVRHLAYVLGPARNWAGFGGLEVSVLMPDDYLLVASPELTKLAEADGVARYGATFDELPAEVLRLSTMAKLSPYVVWQTPVEFGLPLLVAGIVGLASGLGFSRLRRPLAAFLIAGGVAFVGSLLLGTTLVALIMWNEPMLSATEDLVSAGGYLHAIALVLWVPMMAPFLASLLGSVWAGTAARRRAKPSTAGVSKGSQAQYGSHSSPAAHG